jgi:hypothetical protein
MQIKLIKLNKLQKLMGPTIKTVEKLRHHTQRKI